MNLKDVQWVQSIKKMKDKDYWDKPNTVEFIAFVFKSIIIIPGLLFNHQFWWLYIFSLISSIFLVWSSTQKTLPTLIWFNILWIFLSIFAMIKHILI